RRLAALHRRDRALQRARKIARILDGSFAVHAEAFRHHGVVDVRIVDRAADVHAIDASLPPVRNGLQLHDLRVIAAVVMHDVEQRSGLVRASPEVAWPELEPAAPHKLDRGSSIFLVGGRATEGGGRYLADATAPPPADVLVVTIRSPQLLRPAV